MYNDYSMMSPGGPGGVSITGEWINKRTGKKITVRDNIIGEHGMEVRCSDGSMINMQEFSRDYIQASDELYNESGQIIGKASKEDDKSLLYDLNPGPQKTKKEVKREIDNSIYMPVVEDKKPSTSNSTLIEKIFNKTNSIPQIDLTIDWADFPQQELNTLINFLDVDPNEIAEYIYNKYVDKEAIKTKVTSFILSKTIK